MRKKCILVFIFFISMLFPIKILGLTEEEVRKVITDYTNFVYNNKSSTISYVKPENVNFNEILSANYTNGSTFGVDCNAFASFVVYNALQANQSSDVFDKFGRVGGNANNGWSSHSQYYSSKLYMLREGETLYDAGIRYDIKSKLKPGDLIGVVGYEKSSYSTYNSGEKCDVDPDQAICHKYTHIMIYVGDGKYIHNGSNGVKISTLPTMSHGKRIGSTFDGGTHGSITIFTLKNYSSLSSSLVGKIRYPNGNGKYEYYKPDGSLYVEEIAVSSISLDKSSASVKEGSTIKLTATILPSGATNKTITWMSSDTSVATVNSSGLVTAKKEGTAIITAKTSNGKTANARITVTAKITTVSVKGVSAIPSEAKIKVGAQVLLTANINPSNASNKEVTWSSSNPSVATVNSSGLVKAISAGETKITVKTKDGNFTANAIIKVEKLTEPEKPIVTPGVTETPIQKINVTEVEIVPYEAKIGVGEIMVLDFKIYPKNATNQVVTWVSEDPSIATVDKNGILVGKSEGTTKITVTSEDGSISSTAVITVIKNETLSNDDNTSESEDEPNKNSNTRLALIILSMVFTVGAIITSLYVIIKSKKVNSI